MLVIEASCKIWQECNKLQKAIMMVVLKMKNELLHLYEHIIAIIIVTLLFSCIVLMLNLRCLQTMLLHEKGLN